MYKMQNYSDLFLFFRFNDRRSCVHRFTSHALVYVYGGELEIIASELTVTVKTGETAFVRKGACLSLAACRKGNRETKMAILRIPESFLREFYFTVEKQENIPDVPNQSVFPIPPREDIQSLFCSMSPYYESGVLPSEKILKLKIIEAIYALLRTDRLFHTLLFGFAYGGEIHILDLLVDIRISPFHWHENETARIELDSKPS